MNRIVLIITCVLFIALFIYSPSNTSVYSDISTIERIEGNTRIIDYVDESGRVMVHPLKGYSTLIQILDSNNNPIEEYYLDVQGNRVACNGGYFGIESLYEGGHCVQYTYRGRDGEVVNNQSGFALVKQEFEKNGQVIRAFFFNSEFMPVAMSTGQYGEQREYNVNGQLYKVIYLDKNGNPTKAKQGYSAILKEYSLDGLLLYDWYANLNNETINIGRGQYGIKYIYRDGVRINSIPVDSYGRQLFYFDRFLMNSPWIIGIIAFSLIILILFMPKRFRIILFGAYAIFILFMTLFRESGGTSHNFILFWSYRQLFLDRNMAIQVFSNIWLFIPLGAMLAAVRQKPQIILLAVAFSILIEFTQLVFGLGLCEIDDIVSNSLGSWLGYGCLCEGMVWKSKMMKTRSALQK